MRQSRFKRHHLLRGCRRPYGIVDGRAKAAKGIHLVVTRRLRFRRLQRASSTSAGRSWAVADKAARVTRTPEGSLREGRSVHRLRNVPRHSSKTGWASVARRSWRRTPALSGMSRAGRDEHSTRAAVGRRHRAHDMTAPSTCGQRNVGLLAVSALRRAATAGAGAAPARRTTTPRSDPSSDRGGLGLDEH